MDRSPGGHSCLLRCDRNKLLIGSDGRVVRKSFARHSSFFQDLAGILSVPAKAIGCQRYPSDRRLGRVDANPSSAGYRRQAARWDRPNRKPEYKSANAKKARRSEDQRATEVRVCGSSALYERERVALV